jgi:hypothetical protein
VLQSPRYPKKRGRRSSRRGGGLILAADRFDDGMGGLFLEIIIDTHFRAQGALSAAEPQNDPLTLPMYVGPVLHTSGKTAAAAGGEGAPGG